MEGGVRDKAVSVPFARVLRRCLRAAGAPRGRPSFPTRRSSDLGSRPGGEWIDAVRAVLVGQPCPTSTARTDRKSTRLNSSHRTISYAVFCVKKKRHIPQPRPYNPPLPPRTLFRLVHVQPDVLTS